MKRAAFGRPFFVFYQCVIKQVARLRPIVTDMFQLVAKVELSNQNAPLRSVFKPRHRSGKDEDDSCAEHNQVSDKL